MTKPGYLITAEGRGVFLGLVHVDDETIGVWSHARFTYFVPPYAAVFPSAEQAYRLADMFDPPPEGLELVCVLADVEDEESGMIWATPEAVKAAGVQPWILPDTETINSIPT